VRPAEYRYPNRVPRGTSPVDWSALATQNVRCTILIPSLERTAVDRPIFQDLVPIPRVWERMAAVERRLSEVTVAETAFLTNIAQHLLSAGGKRYRPLLAQVAAEFGPNTGAEPVEAGVSVELVHLGSLYHDDVIDEADSRRGQTSVNANWDNTIAILAGDFLLARASEVAAPLGEEAVALIARTYATLCEGQVSELVWANDLSHGPAGYHAVIGGKTASLIRTSARLGAITGGADPDTVEAISEWAWEMGMVFQITDDVLDLIASEGLSREAGRVPTSARAPSPFLSSSPPRDPTVRRSPRSCLRGSHTARTRSPGSSS
jgi:heptaprenyl diphosphate synthase